MKRRYYLLFDWKSSIKLALTNKMCDKNFVMHKRRLILIEIQRLLQRCDNFQISWLDIFHIHLYIESAIFTPLSRCVVQLYTDVDTYILIIYSLNFASGAWWFDSCFEFIDYYVYTYLGGFSLARFARQPKINYFVFLQKKMLNFISIVIYFVFIIENFVYKISVQQVNKSIIF